MLRTNVPIGLDDMHICTWTDVISVQPKLLGPAGLFYKPH